MGYKCFRGKSINEYFRILFHGEEKYGRVVYLEELDEEKITMTFGRFVNHITKTKSKIIGF